MRDLLTLSLLMLSIFMGGPCLLLGAAGLRGTLADASYSENLTLAVPFLAVAALLLVTSSVRIVVLIRSAHVPTGPAADKVNGNR